MPPPTHPETNNICYRTVRVFNTALVIISCSVRYSNAFCTSTGNCSYRCGTIQYAYYEQTDRLMTKAWYGTVLVREKYQQHITCDKKHPVRGVAAA